MAARFYRALESVSMASALSTALTIHMPDPSPSNADSLKLQLLTARKKEWWPATAGSLQQVVTCQL